MKDLLLDTHIWIWLSLAMNKNLSSKAKKNLKAAERKWISAISIWELCKLVEKGKISFSIPLITWIQRSLLEQNISVIHLEPEICVESCSLPDFHSDPADQLIVATSRILSYPLVSSDMKIRNYQNVKVIW